MSRRRLSRKVTFIMVVIVFLSLMFNHTVIGSMTSPTVENELPQIAITQTSYEEWFFMARLEIGVQAYMFVDSFTRTISGQNPTITQESNTVTLSQGSVKGKLQPPSTHTLVYPSYSLPSVKSSAPLTPSPTVETYFTFTSVMNPPYWYADGSTAYPSLTSNTDMTGYVMVGDVTGYYCGKPITGVGSYDHVWIKKFNWNGFYYENWMWFECDTFAGHIVETRDNSGTYHWLDGGIFFYDSGWVHLSDFTIRDVGDQWHYDVTIPTPRGTIEFLTSNPIYGHPYNVSSHVVFTIDGSLNGQTFGGYGGNEVRRNSPPNHAPPTPTLIHKPDQDYSTTTVTWNPVIDPDGGAVTYNVRVGTSKGASNVLSQYGVDGTTSSQFATTDNVIYYWSVQSSDGSLNSSWAIDDSFTDLGSTTKITLSGPTVTEDCMIVNGTYSTYNYGASNLAIGSYTKMGIKGRILLRWDLTSIPLGSRIISAKMWIYCYKDDYGTNNMTINVYRLLKPWIEGNQLGKDRNLDTTHSSCWIEYGNNMPWGSPGADDISDRGFDITSSTTSSGIGWYTFNITNAVQKWVNGSWDNKGLMLIASNENVDDFKYFTPSESSTKTQLPRLEITYETP